MLKTWIKQKNSKSLRLIKEKIKVLSEKLLFIQVTLDQFGAKRLVFLLGRTLP